MEPLRTGDPRQVGPYQLVGSVGENELGRAYAGRHPSGSLVTVTVLDPQLAADPQFRDRLRQDVNNARRVPGPFVVPVDADTDGQTPWLAGGNPDAPTLASAVAGSGPLPPRAVRELAVALTGALAGAQQAGVRVVGLEPSHVLMTPEGPRLSHVGITHPAAGGPGTDPDTVHALGAVLYFAAGGRPPAAEGGWQPGPPPVADPVLAQLITGCLAARPAARPTLQDLAGRLNAGGPTVTAPAGAPGVVPPPPAGAWAAPVAAPPPPGAGAPAWAPPGAPPPQAPIRPQQPWWRAVPGSVVAAAVVLAAVAALALTAGGSDDFLAAQPGASSSRLPGMSLPDGLPTDDGTNPDDSSGGSDDSDGGSRSDGSQDPTASPTDDPISTAETGDCFDNDGTAENARLTPTMCAPQTFEVVQVLRGTTSTSGCDNIPDDSWNVSYPEQDMVLCLSYQYENGSAYHAVAGDCVYGTSATSDWNQLDCQTGAFTVQKRYTGTLDDSRCRSLRNNDWSEHFEVGGRSDLDVTICLSMIYPDDAGHAVLNQCMHFSGTSTQPSLHAAKCGSANVVVTGRTPKYNDSKFCGNDAWATWKPNNYSQLSYTLCYRRR